ncbi:MAG: bifunctional (p)ppGpp synthetase/guanosine-3',5'-bis(diphosphate) 3'-pyrophosphohydrolase [Ruminococcaceae bacterium]|nr:bifunctional (p)ppGpp synthetase/guanosine-3',5'-bis(diphosphate) 3'-pyrophosphohydrolase [Oscillospiraceae bacterium]
MHEDFEQFFDLLIKSGKNYDTEKIIRAYKYAAELHEGQFRQSGEPYISHPIAVAKTAAELGLDTDSLCAALMHDVLEDCGTKTDINYIKKEFGEDVANLVDGLTKLVHIPFEDKEELHMESLRKMFLAMSKDIRVIFIKLCDRLHNMRTLAVKNDERRRMIALETMQVYAPLAHRLGMQRLKQQLENLALIYLDPIGMEEVKRDIETKYGMNRDFLENAKLQISKVLTESNLKFALEGRVKSVYSIYRKMYEQNKSFDEIYDFYAVRILVDTELECYTVLGLIHDMFKSVPGRFKDYISTPKPNMYRSLHTTVIGRGGIPFEVQIRTWEMHHIAEYGVAAHWKYKTGEESREDIDKKLEWIAKLVEIEDETKEPDEFMRALKIDILHDEIFVFTPKGDIITLPFGSTVIDFAYAIHSAVGNKMIGAKINNKIVPIDTHPQNGEIVEIITSASSKGPSRDWLGIVTTSEARNKIRQWFKKEKRAENIIVGRAELEKEFKRFGANCNEEQRTDILTNVAARMGIHSAEDLCNVIGYGGYAVSKISAKLRDEYERYMATQTPSVPEKDEDIISAVQSKTASSGKRRSSGGVMIDGVEGCSVKFAKCCNPLPGDNIVGFITKGYGVSIHKHDCPNLNEIRKIPENAARFVSAYWELGTNGDNEVFEATIQVTAQNSVYLLVNLTSALAEMKVTLSQINTRKIGDTVIVDMVVCCKNLEHFKSIMSKLKTVKGVENVARGGSYK